MGAKVHFVTWQEAFVYGVLPKSTNELGVEISPGNAHHLQWEVSDRIRITPYHAGEVGWDNTVPQAL